MPELPEVEAARGAVEEHCLGKVIRRAVVADDSKVIDGVSSADFQASLLGKTIVSARRKGKNMWLVLSSPPFPSFQFGMTGAVYIRGVAVTKYKRSAVNDTDEWPSKYSKVFIELEDGTELSFTDKRRFAKVRLLEDPAFVPPLSELGPDALLQPMTIDEFTCSLSKKKIAIKALLLDQSYISGIGNWIADEVLYQANVHPLQIAASLSEESCAALHKSIMKVLEKAVEVGADGTQYPSNWIVHSRDKKPGKAFVDGKKIEFITAGGRTTAFVPELRKLIGAQATKAAGRSRKQPSENDTAEDVAAGELENEDNASSVKLQNGQNLKKGASKKPAKNRKPKSRDEDDDSNSNDQKRAAVPVKKATQGKGRKTPAKRKSKEHDDDHGGVDDDYVDHSNDGNSDDQKALSKVTKATNTQKKTLGTCKKVQLKKVK